MSEQYYDVAIVGGGPAGAGAAIMLRKYAPELRVAVFEREAFPRDHVGESLLPVACKVLNEMGCWDQIEAAGFPVKIGATYRWGGTDDLWDFDFLAGQPYEDAARPAGYVGQRRDTAFQVDRSVFDKILLDYARSQGADVFERTRVTRAAVSGERVDSLISERGATIRAHYYVDATGGAGLLRRSLGLNTIEPVALRNIAVWAYWQNADWAVNIGVSGTRVQIMSLGWGWLWFIPVGPTRTSLGLVVPAEYYKASGKRPEELYLESVRADPHIASLLANAHREDAPVLTTRDWSFVSERMAGATWFLIGEAGGFADPILSAGVSMALVGASDVAATIHELEIGEHEPGWLLSEFERQQSRRLDTHIRFAHYWYTANTHFQDLVEYTSEIARESGLTLDPKQAWQWLGTGGFVEFGGAGFAGYSLVSANWLISNFSQAQPDWNVAKNNLFALDLEGAERIELSAYREGRVLKIPGFRRGGRVLPVSGVFAFLFDVLSKTNRLDHIVNRTVEDWCKHPASGPNGFVNALQALEGLVNDGWVEARHAANVPMMNFDQFMKTKLFRRATQAAP
jgi:flavin-dependent dehydrogenase